MSTSQEHDASASSSGVQGVTSEKDFAAKWKRLMTSQYPPSEHIYLAPSLTRTPTPPLLLDRSKEASPSSQNATLLNSSQNLTIEPPATPELIAAVEDNEKEEPTQSARDIVDGMSWNEKIGFDDSTVTGALSNGLKYYVKADGVPMNRVHLRMVVKVGSVHEEPHERGFAHLIEHLVFRHTASFKDNEIQRFLSSLGAKPGADSNATTYHDYTTFGLIIPVDERTIDYGFSNVDMGVKVLSEMAMKVQLTDRILEQERRIVLEECRLTQTSFAKRNALVSKAALCETPYADTAPIGNMNVLKECNIDQLLSFYHKWYRPSNMAIIAVGGFKDASILVSLIERHFGEGETIQNEQVSKNSSEASKNSSDASKNGSFETKSIHVSLPTIPSFLFEPRSDFNIGQSSDFIHRTSASSSSEHGKPNQQQFYDFDQPASPSSDSSTSSPKSLRNTSFLGHSSGSNAAYNVQSHSHPFSSPAATEKILFHSTHTRDDSQSHVVLIFRHSEQLPQDSSLSELKARLTIQVLSWLLNNRANLLVNAYLGRLFDLVASESRLTSHVRAFEIGFSCASGCELETLHRLITEIERLKRFLIADEDMDQLKSLATELCERENRMKMNGLASDLAADKLVKNYLYNEPFEHASLSEHIWRKIIDSWTPNDFLIAAQRVFDMSAAVLFVSLPTSSNPSDTNTIVHPSSRAHRDPTHPHHEAMERQNENEENHDLDSAPVRPQLTKEDFVDVIKGVERMELDPIYFYKVPKILTADQIPDPGRIISVTHKSPTCSVYTLENGARIQLNSVDASNQKHSLGIDLELNAEGGLAEFWCAEGLGAFHSALVSNAFAKYISIGGVAMGSSPVELGVILVEMETFLFERRARFSSLSGRGFETMLQIIYCLFMNHPASWKQDFCRQELDLMLDFARTSRSPESKLRERAIALSWSGHPLIRPLGESDLQKVSISTAIRFFEKAWSNPAEFLFRFSGDFSTPELQQRAIGLISRYVGSIPERRDGDFDPDVRTAALFTANSKLAKSVRFRKGVRRDILYDSEEGIARVILCFPIPSFKTSLEFEVSEVVTLMLETYLFQILRSHLARVYSVSVSSVHHFGPFFPGDASIQFVCDPTDVPSLIDRVFDAIEDLQLHGPSHRLLESSRNIYRKQKEASTYSNAKVSPSSSNASSRTNTLANANRPSSSNGHANDLNSSNISSSSSSHHQPPSSSNTASSSSSSISNALNNDLHGENDGLNSVFGAKAATRDIDLLLDNKLAKWLFTLLFPLDNYVQVIMLPESHIPPKPKQTWASPVLYTLGAVAVVSTAIAALQKLKPHYSSSSTSVNKN